MSTDCFRAECHIIVEVKGNKMLVHADSPAGYYFEPDRPGVEPEVNMETDIIPDNSDGFGIEYTGGSPTMIKELKVEWK